ncbi:synaptotagmin-14 [Sergentomyia squamirostris]
MSFFDANTYNKTNKFTNELAKPALDQFSNWIQWRSDGKDSVLDIGTGPGNSFKELLYPKLPVNFTKLVCSDIASEMVELQKKEFQGHDKVSCEVLDIGADVSDDLVRRIGSFDHITSFYCLMWIADQQKAMDNIIKLLKPGGDAFLVIAADNPIIRSIIGICEEPRWKDYFKGWKDFYAFPYMNLEEAEAKGISFMKNAGFVDIKAELRTAIALLVLLILILLYFFRKQCLRTSPHKSWTRNLLKTKSLLRRMNRSLHDEVAHSESEEAILTRFIPVPSDQAPKYAQVPPTSGVMYQEAFRGNAALHSVIIAGKDPLEVAERGRVGIASSECSSNSSGDTLPENSIVYLTEERRELQPSDVPFSREFQQQRDREKRKHRRHSDGSERSERRSSKAHRYKKRLQDITDVDEITTAEPPTYLFVSPSREHLLEETTSQCNESLKSPSSVGTSVSRHEAPTDKFHPPSNSSYGSVEIALLYDAPMRKMTVHVLQARDIPLRGASQVTYTQIRLLILPSKKQKHKTKIRTGENPQFMESFLLHRINPEEVNSMGLRIRVYSCARMRREHLIGESIVKFGSIDLEYEANMWLILEPKTHVNLSGSNSDLISLARSDSISSTASVKHGGVPELLLGLAYNGTTGRLTTEIIKGIHFRQMLINKTLDTYVKLCLVNSIGQEMSRAKSSIRRAQLNPLFKETFTFQIALFQLNDVTLMVSVYSKRNMKRNEMIGWFSLGLNSSGPDEMNHWNDMREANNGEVIIRWHVLLQN